jgi:hypothetical protein
MPFVARLPGDNLSRYVIRDIVARNHNWGRTSPGFIPQDCNKTPQSDSVGNQFLVYRWNVIGVHKAMLKTIKRSLSLVFPRSVVSLAGGTVGGQRSVILVVAVRVVNRN